LDFIFAPRTIDVCVGEKRIALGDPRSNPFASLNPATGTLIQKLGLVAYLLRTADAAKSVEEELSHLGNLYSRVLKPFLSGVFLTSPASVNAVIGKGLVTSFISGKPGLPRKGVGALPAALAARIQKIELNHRIDSLSQFDNQQVIVATDLTTAAQLLDIANVPKLAGSTTWYYEVPQELTGSPRLLIDGEHRGPVVNSIVLSNLISTYAPDGKSLLASTTLDFASESEVRRHLALMWGAHTGGWSLLLNTTFQSRCQSSRLVIRAQHHHNFLITSMWRGITERHLHKMVRFCQVALRRRSYSSIRAVSAVVMCG
jgi:hypothetical protein